MNHALFTTPAPRNDKSTKLFNSLQLLSLPGQTLNIDLGAKTAISSRRLRGTSQLLESLEVLIRKGVGTDRAEGGGRASTGSEELVDGRLVKLICGFLEYHLGETYGAGGAEEGNQGSLYHITVDTDTPYLFFAAGGSTLDVCGGLHFTTQTTLVALADRVFLVVHDVEIDAQSGQSGGKSGDGTVTRAGDSVLDTVDLNDTSEATLEVLSVKSLARCRRRRRLGTIGGNVVVDEMKARV